MGIEAIANKLPVITTDLNAVQEWCINEYFGLLFKNKSQNDLIVKIKSLASNSKLYENLQTRGFDYISKKYIRQAQH